MFRKCLAVTAVSVIAIGSAARAQDMGDQPAARTETVAVDDAARATLHKLAAGFASVQNVSMTVGSSLTVEGPNFPRMERGQKQQVVLERPNHFVVTAEEDSLRSDGTDMTLHVSSLKKYASQPAPANFDAAMTDRIVQMLMPFGPLAMGMFTADPVATLLDGLSDVRAAGTGTIDGVAVDKVSFVQQPGGEAGTMYISTGDAPRIVRFELDQSGQFAGRAEADPRFKDVKAMIRLDFTAWENDSKLAADTFAFNAPEGVVKAESVKAMFAREQGPHPLVGQPAPDFELASLDGSKVSLASLKDKNVVVLDFWATWCGPCVAAMPVISSTAAEFADQGVLFYAVNLREDIETIKPFLQKHNLNVNVLLDADGSVGEKYQANAIPQTVIVGKDGMVKVVEVGFNPDGQAEFRQKIADAVAGK